MKNKMMMTLNEQVQKIKKIMGLHENKQVYPYGCVMLYFDDSNVKDIHSQIDPDDLYIEGDGFGIEGEPHCTLLYGLHNNVTDDDVIGVLNNHSFGTCKAHNLSCFENEKYDVLKFDVDGDGLFNVNDDLKQFPYTTDYPDYHPHMTIAYLKPGKGKKYIEMLESRYGELSMKPQYGVYSKTDGSKNKIPVRIN
jgi:hypothetical protein